jgi:FKBP-type peptidyl-prolyl cis-trans isomerase 2
MASKKPVEPKRKNNSPKLVILVIIVIAVLVSAFYLPSLLQQKTIGIGDCAQVQYIGRFTTNGTIFAITYASSIGTIGTPQNLFVNPNSNLFPPSKCGATVQPADMPYEALRALVGMKEGETRNITLPSAKAFGDWDTNLAAQFGLETYPVDEIWYTTVENLSTVEFSYYFPNVPLNVGTTFDYWGTTLKLGGVLNAQITRIENDSVTFKMLPINGLKFIIPPFNWTATIVVINQAAFDVHSDIPLNLTFSFTNSTSGKTYYGKVIALNDTEATIGLNSAAPSMEFVGQSLTFEFKVVKITKTGYTEH